MLKEFKMEWYASLPEVAAGTGNKPEASDPEEAINTDLMM
jgi:hypothetical protein